MPAKFTILAGKMHQNTRQSHNNASFMLPVEVVPLIAVLCILNYFKLCKMYTLQNSKIVDNVS